MFMNYSEQSQDVRWQRKRLLIFQRDNWTCVRCAKNTGSFHVHHKYYSSGKRIWEYPLSALELLCAGCHSEHHSHDKIRTWKSVKHKRDEEKIERLADLFLKYIHDEKFKAGVDSIYNKSMNKPNYDQAA